MDLLLPIAAKSFLVAGAVLLLLKIAQNRSASDRSWIAHLGLVAVLLLPAAALALPALNVEGPSFLVSQTVEAAAPAEPLAAAPESPALRTESAAAAGTFPGASAAIAPAPVDWAVWAYAAPAVLLLLLTLIALGRLFGLKGRASVMVEPNWLTALARAQRRMGFKHGTALLTSDELPSPISWGVVRPVILLNTKAAESHGEAEAIIAHELAHVASLDWAKLLLSRVTVALFWFNPLVWVLAREAHQLREEAADDAVLGADIEDTEYAKLLVGVARHECRGLLIGAHGVAPAKNSLARRVRRVLDGALERAPGGWRWSTAAAFFAAGMAVPVAALNFVAPAPASASHSASAQPVAAAAAAPSPAAAAASAQQTAPRGTDVDSDVDVDEDVDVDVDVDGDLGEAFARLDSKLRGAFNDFPRAERSRSVSDREVDEIIKASAHGVDGRYIAGMRAASPRLSRATIKELVSLKVQGVTPNYVRALASAGYPSLDVDQIVAGAVQGVSPTYARAMANAGVGRLDFDNVVQMKVLGVSPEYVRKLRAAGFSKLTAAQIINMSVHGVDPDDYGDSQADEP
jgi:beta-lactamase regulating signal transducer with metallopeptidase domain